MESTHISEFKTKCVILFRESVSLSEYDVLQKWQYQLTDQIFVSSIKLSIQNYVTIQIWRFLKL